MHGTAIIPGGTSGLGAAIAALLRERGTRVVTVSRREAADVSGDAKAFEKPSARPDAVHNARFAPPRKVDVG